MERTKALLLCSFLFSLGTWAKDPVGKIDSIKGNVSVISSGGRVLKALVENTFYVGDTFQTKAESKIKLTFFEGSNTIVLGPDTVFSILAASTIKEAAVSSNKKVSKFNLTRGDVRAILKERSYNIEEGESFEIQTPTAIAGVRGTIFVVNFDDATQETSVATLRGRVNLKDSKDGSVSAEVNEGTFSQLNSQGKIKAPALLKMILPKLKQAIENTLDEESEAKARTASLNLEGTSSTGEAEMSAFDRVEIKNPNTKPEYKNGPSNGIIPSVFGDKSE